MPLGPCGDSSWVVQEVGENEGEEAWGTHLRGTVDELNVAREP